MTGAIVIFLFIMFVIGVIALIMYLVESAKFNYSTLMTPRDEDEIIYLPDVKCSGCQRPRKRWYRYGDGPELYHISDCITCIERKEKKERDDYLNKLYCPTCRIQTYNIYCSHCGAKALEPYKCLKCNVMTYTPFCNTCGGKIFIL